MAKGQHLYKDPEPRFLAKIKTMPNGCIEWQGYRMPSGYGQFSVNGRLTLTHCYAWERVQGPVPEGKELDHLCRNPPCVNVEHLEPVTHQVNTLRGISPAAQQAKRTHCLKGHPFDLINTVWRGNKRCCHACQNERNRIKNAERGRRRAERRAQRAAEKAA